MLKQLHEQIEALNLHHYTNMELSNSQLIIMRTVGVSNYQCIAEVINIAELTDDSIYDFNYNGDDAIVITLV